MADKIYKAKNEVHITVKPGKAGDRSKGIAPTPPETKVIQAGTNVSLNADSDLCKELLAAGAIVLADVKVDKEATKVAAKKASTASKRKTPAKKTTAASTDATANGGDGGDGGSDDDNEDLM